MIRSIVLLGGFFAFSGCNATAWAVTEYPALKGGSLPHRIAKGPDGNMWFTEQTGQRIGRIGMAGAVAEFALPAGGNPIGVAAGPDGNMWFTESLGHRIGRIDAGGKISELSAGLSAGSSPQEIASAPDGALWFTEDVRLDGKYGGKIGRVTTSSMWFTIPQDHRIGRITPDGKIATFAMPDQGDGTGSPSNIALGPDGAMCFTEFNQSRIGRITTAGTIAEFYDGINGGSSPDGIALGPDGSLWFKEYNGNRIGKLPGKTRT